MDGGMGKGKETMNTIQMDERLGYPFFYCYEI
jgi:hypothetical protein